MKDLRNSLKYLSPVLTKHTDLIIEEEKVFIFMTLIT